MREQPPQGRLGRLSEAVIVGFIGWVWWTVLPIRKAVAVDNYRQAFPERDPGELRQTVGELVLNYWDLFRGVRVRVERPSDRDPELQEDPPGIVLAGHGGAWDLAMMCCCEQFPVTIFVRTPSNPLAARLIEGVRRRSGVELLPPSGSREAAYEALARGRFVVFVQDQRHNRGIPVPFFGRPAWTSPGFAAMVHRTRAPVYTLWQWREGGRHRVVAERAELEVPEDRDEAIEVLTRWTQEVAEAHIRSRPYSWLWLHDRWRSPRLPR